MKHSTTTSISTHLDHALVHPTATPVLLLAHSLNDACTVDRCAVTEAFTIGRSADCDLPIKDSKISKHHFQLSKDEDGYFIEDLGSKNGTFLMGLPITRRQALPDSGVIRAGRTVLVFHEDGRQLLQPPPVERYNMAGRFHVAPITAELAVAAKSKRHVLLAGASGTGKELAARALASMIERESGQSRLVVHNAAQYSSEEEAMVSIFGVGTKVFSGVDARSGLIEEAADGTLFLDEIHNLPERVQRGLLRVIEDGRFERIGETRVRTAEANFIFATNAPRPTFEVAHDLLARLLLIEIPPIKYRVADVPTIFNTILSDRLGLHGSDPTEILPLFSGNHYEALCLDGFEKFNVRGLIDLADKIALTISSDVDPATVITSVFAQRFQRSGLLERYQVGAREPTHPTTSDQPTVPAPHDLDDQMEAPPVTPSQQGQSIYEQNKASIIAEYKNREGNVAATERILRSRGIPCSRRWLAIYLQKWGER